MKYAICIALVMMVNRTWAVVVQGAVVDVNITATYVTPTCDISMPTTVSFPHNILAGTMAHVSESFAVGVSCSHSVPTSLQFSAANVDTSLSEPWANRLTVGGAVTNAYLALFNQGNSQYMYLDGSYSAHNCSGTGDYICSIRADIQPNGLAQTGMFSEAVVVSIVFN